MKTLTEIYNEYTKGNKIFKRKFKPKHLFITLSYLLANGIKEVMATRTDEITSIIQSSVYSIDSSKPILFCGITIYVSSNPSR